MEDGNGRPHAPDEQDELPPALSALFAIEECVGETVDALAPFGDEADQAHAFVSGIHRAVKVWLSWELWAALLDPGHYTPDSLLESVLERGVDVHQLPRSGPATPPRPAPRGMEWRAFEGGERRG
jgi:hypothetical protein